MNHTRRPRRGWLVPAFVLGLAACTSGDPFEALPVPNRPPASTTSSEPPPDFRGVALAPVEGATTTSEVVVGPGPSRLAGRVDGPDGPVEGAVVHLERLVDDAGASLDVTTGPDGTWQVPDVLGGRYRIRAWRTPDLAMLEPQILFLEAGRTADIALGVERFQASVVDTAIAPDPPSVGSATNVLVRLSSQIVDDDGMVRASPRPSVVVTLGVGAGWVASSPVQAATDAAGAATFTLVCRSPGVQPLMVTVPATTSATTPMTPIPTAPGSVIPDQGPVPEVLSFNPPECVPRPPPTLPPTTGVGPPTTGSADR